MNWKRYKGLSKEEKRDEIYYIIGLDIGNDSSGIAFYNLVENEPEMIDLSGGYGRPTIPTVMQYIAESKEWVFGEYAILNRGMGREITLSALFERLGRSEYVDIDNRPMSVVSLLGMYIRELLSNVKLINPKAEIAGIVASVPSYFSETARNEFVRAIKSAGYEKELIGLVSDRECVFAHHFRTSGSRAERGLLIDYGARGVRGGVYSAKEKGDTIALRSLSSLFDDNIGTQYIIEQVRELFTGFYLKNNPIQARQQMERQLQEQLKAFVYQHKDILFQKAIRNKPSKLYFNFAFPPFQQTVTAEISDKLVEPFRQGFNRFIREVLEKNLYENEKITAMDIDTVLCVGGGFEMLWTREVLSALFPQEKLRLYRNSKAVTAMGAATVAALKLEAIEGHTVVIEDSHQLSLDIGLAVGQEKMVPLAECNSFWWQKHPAKLFIVNSPVEGAIPLTIVSRSPDGDVKTLSKVQLVGLPTRPKGTTRLSVTLKFLSDKEATATIADCGFGELFPKTDYVREIAVRL